jgi:hypothetical protein
MNLYKKNVLQQLAFERFGLSLLDTRIHVKLPWLPCKQNRDRVVCKIKDVPKRSFGKGTKSQTSLGWKGDHNREKMKTLSSHYGRSNTRMEKYSLKQDTVCKFFQPLYRPFSLSFERLLRILLPWLPNYIDFSNI